LLIADETVVAEVGGRLLGRPVVEVERISGGRNSQVYRLDCDPHTQPSRYVLKQYFTISQDPRDRLDTEYRALQLLRSRGVANVPAPIAKDVATRCAVYEFVPGERASFRTIEASDIRQTVDLLAELKAIARRCREDEAGPASEACFSIDAIVRNIAGRVARLRALPVTAPGKSVLQQFLSERFDPFVIALETWTAEQTRRQSIGRDVEIPPDLRTLSPSDLGFHNALKDGAGRLVFVDFEYFGWDDPAKTIVDFLHHPGMDLSSDNRRDFVAGVLATFDDDRGLAARARIVYPWFGLKWCVILLNEFLPEHLRRRNFAGAEGPGHAELLNRQLGRASHLLERVSAEYEHNEYFE
jgi:hypothetical protein